MMVIKRKGISRSTRFKVFNRDGFICQYCGQQPPKVVLEVDHISPVSGGGSNRVENLITACFDCNRGKAARKLESPAPMNADQKLELVKERELQIKALKKVMAEVENRVQAEIQSIQKIYSDSFADYCLTEGFLDTRVRYFLSRLPCHEVQEAMRIAIYKISDSADVPRYFCGVCWNKIKGGR